MLCLWAGVGFQVGLQNSDSKVYVAFQISKLSSHSLGTCDADWQATRDQLIIASFALSLIVIFLVAVLVVIIGEYCC
jgi:hypothetical protein